MKHPIPLRCAASGILAALSLTAWSPPIISAEQKTNDLRLTLSARSTIVRLGDELSFVLALDGKPVRDIVKGTKDLVILDPDRYASGILHSPSMLD